MEYPKNGSVVIIDDKIDDVEDLMLAFSMDNVPVFYFTGKEEKLHNKLDNLKVIFLDVDFEHTPRANKTAKVDFLVTIVQRLINKNTGEYIIVTWSTLSESYHSDLKLRLEKLHKMKDRLDEDKQLHKIPKDVFSINKTEIKTGGLFDLDKLNNAINSYLDPKDIMHLTTHWENNVLDSAKNVLRNFENIAPTEISQKKIYSLFADSISQSESLKAENIISSALAPISNLLSDQLSTYRSPVELNDIGSELVSLLESDSKLDINKVSKINTFYHIDSNEPCHNEPGTIYSYQEYMDSFSCSSNGCNTKWAEGLLSKLDEDFVVPNIGVEIAKSFTEEYEGLKKLRMPFNEELPFDKHIDIYKGKRLELDVVLNKFDNDYTSTLNEKDKKAILKRCAQSSESKITDKLIQFVFDRPKDEHVIEVLNNYSKECDFEGLNNSKQIEVIEKYYNDWKKKKIVDFYHSERIPVFLEFSPDCDFVQRNRKKLRLIFGLMYPYSIYVKNKKNFKGESYIYTPIIEYKNVPYKVVFDLHTITGINEEALSDAKTIFRFRKELLVDIQQQIASHIARPGFFNMNDYLK